MASVGGESFKYVSLPGDPPGEKVEDITRPGVDGTALRETGVKGDTYRLVAQVGAVDKDAAKAKINACKALRGTVVTVVDDHEISWTYIGIMDVRTRKNKGVGSQVGWGAGVTKILTVDFYCKDMRPAP